jgi:hypothetical protein
MQLQQKLHGGLRCATLAWRLKVRSKLGSGAKPATPPTPLPQLRKIKQIAIAEKSAEKKLGEDRLRPSVYSPAQPFAPQPPQNQLQLAECTCRKSGLKICMVGCDVICGVGI